MSEIAAVVLMPRDDLIQGSAAQMGANGYHDMIIGCRRVALYNIKTV